MDAVARYLKIERKPRPVKAEKADGSRSSRKPARKSAERAPAAKAEKKSSRPRAEGRAPRARKRPSNGTAEARGPVQPVQMNHTCPDCDGEIELSWDQCPHCALFLNPGA